ncbi:hypothetical protein QOZ80_3BG0254270 [Eleusine coracana subsp. coracana]|nr:hypothetical protein QOZ80_3BG0254270 [Eleusine coracana subsp. coracana]
MPRLVIPAGSFSPPTLPAPSRPNPAWVLLDKQAYIADGENATTAKARSSGGDTVKVTFCVADPPSLSHLCVHCPGLEDRTEKGFFGEPVVACAAGAFVVLEVAFNFGPRNFSYHGGIRDYFVYKASPAKPCLSRLPDLFPHDIRPCEIGIVPLGGGDGRYGFVVAALHLDLDAEEGTRRPFVLHLFSSRSEQWRTVAPLLDTYSCCHDHNDYKVFLSHKASKVVAVGGGVLGWVDLWRGVLLCDVLADDPVLRLVALPKPTVGRIWKNNPGIVRDVTSDGDNVLTFVEVQFPWSPHDDLRPSKFDSSASDSDSDSDSNSSSRVSHGWRATTWKMGPFSSHGGRCWVKGCTVDSADIRVTDDPTCFQQLPELWDAEAGKLTLKDLDCSAPVLSAHDDGIVYMMSELKNNADEGEAWVLAFDVRRGTVKALAPFSKRTYSFVNTCIPCSFSSYYFDRKH